MLSKKCVIAKNLLPLCKDPQASAAVSAALTDWERIVCKEMLLAAPVGMGEYDYVRVAVEQ